MYTFLKEKVDISKIIKDLGNSFGGSNEDQMRGVTLLKGLATSDDPKANEFMKALDKWTTQQSKKMSESKVIEIQDEIKIVQDGKDLILEKGDKIKILEFDMDIEINKILDEIERIYDDEVYMMVDSWLMGGDEPTSYTIKKVGDEIFRRYGTEKSMAQDAVDFVKMKLRRLGLS
jgi:hypothetical protein